MTTTEKNIAIAEMIGAKIECVYHNTSSGFKMFQAIGDIIEKLRNYSHMPVGKHVTNGIDVANLNFHSDANWQFEAKEYIEKLSYQTYIIYYHHTKVYTVDIWDNSLKVPECIINYTNYSQKEAIFEALYQFSQYLKHK